MSIYKTKIGHGRDLVMLHGWGLHSGLFEDIAAELSQDFCCHLIDLPGFGKSDDLQDDYTLDAIAEKIRHEIPDNARVLGWSMGGLVATRLATLFPQKVAELILVASSPRMVADDEWQHAISPAVLHEFANQLEQDYDGTLMRFLALQSHGSESAKQDIRLLRERVFNHGRPTLKALRGGLYILADTDQRNELLALDIPVTLILGKLDMLVPFGIADELKPKMEKLCVRIIKGAGHAPFISHPVKFIKSIRECQHVGQE